MVATDQTPVRLPGASRTPGRTASRLKQWHCTDCSQRTQLLQVFVYDPFGSTAAIFSYGAALQLDAIGPAARGVASSLISSATRAPKVMSASCASAASARCRCASSCASSDAILDLAQASPLGSPLTPVLRAQAASRAAVAPSRCQLARYRLDPRSVTGCPGRIGLLCVRAAGRACKMAKMTTAANLTA